MNVGRVLAVVTEASVKNLWLAGSSEWVGWFTPSLGCCFYSVRTC